LRPKAQAKAHEIDNFRFPFEQQFDAAMLEIERYRKGTKTPPSRKEKESKM
jgi:hypothetical protein